MNFLQPFMFWGALAVAIPVFIHFWHQKKGKELDWAAMQWLIDKSQQQSRGLRLDNLPLMIVRCILVLLLAFMLAQPVIKWLKQADHAERIHLVEPNKFLVDNFRFEIETALKNGDRVFWINQDASEVKDLSVISNQKAGGLSYVQEVINKVSKPGAKLDLYFLNNSRLARSPKIYIPESYTLHTTIDSSKNYTHNYFDLKDGKKLLVENGQLTVSTNNENGNLSKLASGPIHSGEFKVLVQYKSKAEQQTAEAALASLATVYALPFQIDYIEKKDKKYDLVMSDQKMRKALPETIYLLSGQPGSDVNLQTSSVIKIQDSLRVQTSEIVSSGQLPEFLGGLLVSHYKLKENETHLSQQQLNSVFEQVKPLERNAEGNLRSWLLIIFIALTILERWMALRKTIQKSYV